MPNMKLPHPLLTVNRENDVSNSSLFAAGKIRKRNLPKKSLHDIRKQRTRKRSWCQEGTASAAVQTSGIVRASHSQDDVVGRVKLRRFSHQTFMPRDASPYLILAVLLGTAIWG